MSLRPIESDADAIVATGLHCPTCDYLLVGLPENRCPECGQTFDPRVLRRSQRHTPPWFQRATGRELVVAFVGTWITILATPWLFARQTLGRLRGDKAATFGGICFASTLISLLFGADLAFIATWLTTAAVYLILQTAWLVILDVPHRDQPIQSARYWLSIGGYTSAIVMTEWYFGPPEITLSHLFDLVQLRFGPTMFVANEVRDVVFWAQVVLWLFGLVFCIDARLGSRAWSRGARAVMSVVCFVSLLALYGAAVEHIGVPLYDFFGDVPGLDWKLRP